MTKILLRCFSHLCRFTSSHLNDAAVYAIKHSIGMTGPPNSNRQGRKCENKFIVYVICCFCSCKKENRGKINSGWRHYVEHILYSFIFEKKEIMRKKMWMHFMRLKKILCGFLFIWIGMRYLCIRLRSLGACRNIIKKGWKVNGSWKFVE